MADSPLIFIKKFAQSNKKFAQSTNNRRFFKAITHGFYMPIKRDDLTKQELTLLVGEENRHLSSPTVLLPALMNFMNVTLLPPGELPN